MGTDGFGFVEYAAPDPAALGQLFQTTVREHRAGQGAARRAAGSGVEQMSANDFRQLFDATAPDFTPIYAEVRGAPEIDAGAVLPGEREFAAG